MSDYPTKDGDSSNAHGTRSVGFSPALLKLTFIAALFALAAALLLFGPRPTAPVPAWAARPDGSPPIVVDYWEKWTGDEARQMQEIVTQFNLSVGKDKGIFVRFLSMTKVD